MVAYAIDFVRLNHFSPALVAEKEHMSNND